MKVISLDKLGAQLYKDIAKKFPKKALQAIHETAEESVGIQVTEIKKRGHVDSGGLMAGAEYELDKEGATIFNAQPYSSAIEYGTRPGIWRPLEPFVLWAARKLQADEPEEVGRAVWYSVSVLGTEPKPFFRSTIEKVKKRLKSRFRSIK